MGLASTTRAIWVVAAGVGLSTEVLALELTQDKLVQGRDVRFTATGAAPGALVSFARSDVVGPGPCPPPIDPVCLDLATPELLGSVVADVGGIATLTVAIDRYEPLGVVHTQAVVHGPQADKSPVVTAFLFGVFDGSWTVDTLQEVQDLRMYAEIRGSLTLTYDGDPVVVDLVALDAIGDGNWNSLSVVNSSVTRVTAPALAGDPEFTLSISRNSGLQTIAFDGLVAAKNVNVEASLAATLSLDSLQSVERSLTISERFTGPLSLPALVRVGGLTVENAEITALHLPELQEVVGDTGLFHVLWSPSLTQLHAPRLRTVGSDIEVADSPGLLVLRFDALEQVGGELLVHGNAVLAGLSFPSLFSSSGRPRIYNNPRLPGCHIERVFEPWAGVDLICFNNAIDKCTDVDSLGRDPAYECES